MSGIFDANPFVGPRPIHQGEALHGRETEVRELYEQLQARRIVVLHSPSGAGKSSLVQAGLIPVLRADKFDVWKPIRVNLDPSEFAGLPEGTNRYLLSALISLEDELPAARRRSPSELATLDFLDYLETRPRRKKRDDHSVVLLFDQFEEVLSVGPRAIAAKEAFFTAVGRALDTQKYWALFILREDYLAALAPYRDRIPTQLFNTFRLDLLGLAGAREAAENLAKEGGRSFPAVDKLVRDLSAVQVQQADGTFVAEQGLHVEPVHLQVVCRRLWDAMPEDDPSIDEEDIEAYAQVSKSLAGYYADAVAAIAGADAALERSIRDWVGTKLIVGGIRSQIRQEAGSSAGLDNRHVEKLLDSYLVRTEQRAGANWFELSHDRLVEPVQADNEGWRRAHLHPLQVQAKLWEDGGRAGALLLGTDALPSALAWAEANPGLLTEAETQFLDLSRALRDERASQRRRQRIFTAALAAVAVMAIVFAGIALASQRETASQQREAEHQRREAERQRGEAVAALEQAEQARSQAEQAQTQAEHARTQAEKAREENERAVRQTFEVSLRRFTESLADKGVVTGELELDERWTPLLERNGQAIIAATVGEDSRIVVAGHESVFSEVDDQGDSLFLEISAKWLLADQARRRVAIITHQAGTYPRLATLERNLTDLEYEHEVNPSLESLDGLEDAGMLIIDNRWAAPFSAREIATIDAFIRRGGGVLAAGVGSQWLAKPAAEGEAAPTLANYPMNEVLAAFGVRWTEKTVDPKHLGKRDEPATVRFENESGATVNVLARSGAGREEYYTTLEKDEDREILTSLTKEWVFRAAADDRWIGSAVIEEEDQTITIGSSVATNPKPKLEPKSKPKPKPEPEIGAPQSPAVLPATLGDADMQSALASAKKASKACGKTYFSVSSAVEVEFTILPNGKVSNARALEPLKGLPEGSCAAKAVSALQFPKSLHGAKRTWNLPL